MNNRFIAAWATGLAVATLYAAPAARAEFYAGFGVGGARVEGKVADLGLKPAGFPDSEDPITPIDAVLLELDRRAVDDFSGSNISTQFVVGWRARYFGVEVGYVNFNQFGRSSSEQFYVLPNTPLIPPSPAAGQEPPTVDNRIQCDPLNPAGQPGSFDDVPGCQEREWQARYKADGYQATVIGYLPVSDSIDLFGKVGAIAWESEQNGQERVRNIVPPIPQIPGGNAPVSASDDGTDLTFGLGVVFRTDSPFSVRLQADYYDIGNLDELISYTANLYYTFGGGSGGE
jgi:opacity protein-like surface antigen